MTKKDYVLIASVFNKAMQYTADEPRAMEAVKATVEVVADELADALEQDNPRFDRERFLTACGVNIEA